MNSTREKEREPNTSFFSFYCSCRIIVKTQEEEKSLNILLKYLLGILVCGFEYDAVCVGGVGQY